MKNGYDRFDFRRDSGIFGMNSLLPKECDDIFRVQFFWFVFTGDDLLVVSGVEVFSFFDHMIDGYVHFSCNGNFLRANLLYTKAAYAVLFIGKLVKWCYNKLMDKLKEKGITAYTIRQKTLIPQGTLAKLKMYNGAIMEEILCMMY